MKVIEVEPDVLTKARAAAETVQVRLVDPARAPAPARVAVGVNVSVEAPLSAPDPANTPVGVKVRLVAPEAKR